MERKAGEVSAPWVAHLPELELQHCLSEYVANELKHASILRKRISELNGDPMSCGGILSRNSRNFGIFMAPWALFVSCLRAYSMVMRSSFPELQSRSLNGSSPSIRRLQPFIGIRC